MSEYRCHKCETIHTTENMASICAACFYALRAKLEEAEKRYDGACKIAEKWARTAGENRVRFESAEKGCHGCDAGNSLASEIAAREAAESRCAEAEKKYADLKAEIPGIIGSVQFGTATLQAGVVADMQRRAEDAESRAALSASEERVEAEHELFLTAHRDNMKAALRIAELNECVRVMREGLEEATYGLFAAHQAFSAICETDTSVDRRAMRDRAAEYMRASRKVLAAYPAEQENP